MKAYPASKLLELSLGLEKDTQKLYKDWAKKFSRLPEVAAFWRDYAEEEAIHIRLLKELRARLSASQLATLIECEVVGDTRQLLLLLRKEKVDDVEQAFQYADKLEHSEINPLFIVIVSFFEEDEEARAMVRLLLDKHINKLVKNFPKSFLTPQPRREIKV
ncbi:MAG TPA: ferritin family protein [Anaerolineales bacterium]|nr:ferritin family protein [Anaerolineales bacterium]